MSSIKNPDNMSDSDEKNKIMPGVLYLVATPIGNLADLSERAIKVLSGVDFIAAEDTRKTAKLLMHLGISAPLISYFEHNKRERGSIIISKLKAGESCALVTDAGTPAISDPGEDLVRLCLEHNITVTSIPGCCAAITALTLSGLCTDRFVFEGFLSSSKNERRQRLEELKYDERTCIYYEAPHRLVATLADMFEYLGNRKITLCRELTKLNEEIMHTTLSAAVSYYNDNSPRGEYVLVVEGNHKSDAANYWDTMTISEHVEYHIALGEDRMNAIKIAAKERGVAKSKVYAEYVNNHSADE